MFFSFSKHRGHPQSGKARCNRRVRNATRTTRRPADFLDFVYRGRTRKPRPFHVTNQHNNFLRILKKFVTLLNALYLNQFSSQQRLTIGAYVNHIIVRLIICVLIILDIIFVIVAVSLPDSEFFFAQLFYVWKIWVFFYFF